MYSREKRLQAVELYIRYERSAAAVIHELGYPDPRMLAKWYKAHLEEQVTRRIIERTTTTTKMADELGVHYTIVRDWVRQYKRDGVSAFPGNGHLKPEDDETRKLRRELADLKEKNEIIKKAAAYFAKIQK